MPPPTCVTLGTLAPQLEQQSPQVLPRGQLTSRRVRLQIVENDTLNCIRKYNCYEAFAATTTDDFATEVIPSGDLSLSYWNKYVYRVYSGSNVDQDRCTAMCVFDHPETTLNISCHFTAYAAKVCYLGNFMAERTLLADKVVADLHIKTS